MNRLSSTFLTAWTFRVVAWLAVAWLVGWDAAWVLAVAGVATHGAALFIHRLRHRPPVARLALAAVVTIEVLLFAAVIWTRTRSWALPVGAGVFLCHAVAYLVDVHRGTADPRRHGAALMYLLQLPVFPAGPLSRFPEFAQQVARTDVSMAGFSYGVRRIVTGLTKVYLIGGPLGSTADSIFALRVTRLSTDTAWLGAVCGALEAYFYVSGFSDVGIGLGKMLGFRHQENFRRPFTADSIREFWRRWNITLITWLRDYVALPIAGHDRPTIIVYPQMVAGFVLVGAWHAPTLGVVPWALYFATWLAIEALGLGRLLQRLPRFARHAYVLLVVIVGWTLLRASGPGPLLGYAEAMFGQAIQPFGASSAYLTWDVVTALICGVVFAGPMLGNISRWRVSVDAATASLIMMMAATGVLLWHVSTLVVHLVSGLRRVVNPGGAAKPPR